MIRVFWVCLYFCLTGLGFAQEKSDPADWTLAPGRVGNLCLGMKADTVYVLYNFDQIEIDDLQLEGLATPALKIFYENADAPTLVAEIKQKSELVIDKIHVLDSRFRLANKIGIGSTLADLRKNYPISWIHFCDRGHLCARIDDLKMLFKLDLMEPPDEWLQTEDMALIPDSSKVIKIFVESE